MRVIPPIVSLLACSPLVHALSFPRPGSFSRRDPLLALVPRDPGDTAPSSAEILALEGALEKRRGGGGGSKGGSSGSSGSKSGSSGSKSGSSGSKGGSTGGKSSSPAKTFGGGRFYGGGATAPYSAGNRSPRGIAPFILPVALLTIFPGLWLFSAYAYPYPQPIRFFNRTNTNTAFPNGVNQTLPVLCLCQQKSKCSCDDNSDPTYISDLLGNGSWPALDKTLVQVSNVNGTTTLVLNGTLPVNASSEASRTVRDNFGWWLLGAVVGWTIWMM